MCIYNLFYLYAVINYACMPGNKSISHRIWVQIITSQFKGELNLAPQPFNIFQQLQACRCIMEVKKSIIISWTPAIFKITWAWYILHLDSQINKLIHLIILNVFSTLKNINYIYTHTHTHTHTYTHTHTHTYIYTYTYTYAHIYSEF